MKLPKRKPGRGYWHDIALVILKIILATFEWLRDL